jgi:hypothetical protein
MPTDDDQGRIRAVFGLSDHAPIPKVSNETLLVYRDFLLANLSFPFEALYAETTPPVRRLFRCVAVVGLSDTVPHRLQTLLCRVRNGSQEVEIPLAELGIREDNPNHRLVDDFAHWYWNWR